MKYSISVFTLLTLLSCGKIKNIDNRGILVPQTVIENSERPRLEINGIIVQAEDYRHPIDPLLIVLLGDRVQIVVPSFDKKNYTANFSVK